MAIGKKTGGRIKGTPNKTTVEAKEAIEEAFKRLGDVEALVEWAKLNKTDFYKTVWPKILPLQVNGDIKASVVVEVVKFASQNTSE